MKINSFLKFLPFFIVSNPVIVVLGVNSSSETIAILLPSLKIFELNIAIRKKIVDESNLIDNEVSKTLIKLMLYEINLISSHD